MNFHLQLWSRARLVKSAIICLSAIALMLSFASCNSTDSMDVYPELHLDFTLDEVCASIIGDNMEFSGTSAEIEEQENSVSFLLALPTRYMSYSHISLIKDRINYLPRETGECGRSYVALQSFQQVRNGNPMGRWRASNLGTYWSCQFPGDRWLANGDSPSIDECDALMRWLPASWIPEKATFEEADE